MGSCSSKPYPSWPGTVPADSGHLVHDLEQRDRRVAQRVAQAQRGHQGDAGPPARRREALLTGQGRRKCRAGQVNQAGTALGKLHGSAAAQHKGAQSTRSRPSSAEARAVRKEGRSKGHRPGHVSAPGGRRSRSGWANGRQLRQDITRPPLRGLPTLRGPPHQAPAGARWPGSRAGRCCSSRGSGGGPRRSPSCAERAGAAGVDGCLGGSLRRVSWPGHRVGVVTGGEQGTSDCRQQLEQPPWLSPACLHPPGTLSFFLTPARRSLRPIHVTFFKPETN